MKDFKYIAPPVIPSPLNIYTTAMKDFKDIDPPPPPPDSFIRETIRRIARQFVLEKKLSYVYAVGFRWKPSKYESTPAQIGFFLFDPARKQHQFPFAEIPRTISLLELFNTKDPKDVYGITEVQSKYKVVRKFCEMNGSSGSSSGTAAPRRYQIQPGERIYGRNSANQYSQGSIGGLLKFATDVTISGTTTKLLKNELYALSANHVFPANNNKAYQPRTNSNQSPVDQIGTVVYRDSGDDFALIRISSTHPKTAIIKDVGAPKQPAPNLLITGQTIKKSGISGVTSGIVDYIQVVVINSGTLQIDTRLFTILPNASFATDGDSGSVVVRETIENGQTVYYPVGMLYRMGSNGNGSSQIYYFARNFLDITTLTQASVVQTTDTI